MVAFHTLLQCFHLGLDFYNRSEIWQAPQQQSDTVIITSNRAASRPRYLTVRRPTLSE